MPVLVPINSRFRTSQIVTFNGVETFARWPDLEFMDTTPTTTIITDTKNAGRLDLISTEFFGSPDFWWAIMAFNRVSQLNWPQAGDEVKIPQPSLVLSSV